MSTVQKYFIKQPPQKKTCTSPKICLKFKVRPHLKIIGENLKWIGVDVNKAMLLLLACNRQNPQSALDDWWVGGGEKRVSFAHPPWEKWSRA